MRNSTKNSQSISQAKVLAFMGIMIALDVILVRFLVIQGPAMRISFHFIVVILAGMYLGPFRAGIIGIVADILGMLIFPRGAYFPGFTLSAGITYVMAGYFLEGRKSAKMLNVVVYSVLSTLLIDTVLNSIWLVMLLHQNDFTKFMVILGPRIPFQIVVTVLKIIFIPIIYRTLFKRFRANDVEHPGIRETAV